MGDHQGWLRRKMHRLTADERELEAEALQDQVEAQGAVPVKVCGDRQEVCVAGTIQSVMLKSRAGAPSLEADVYDGTGTVTVVFLGRRRIAGVEAGRSIKVMGRLTHHEHRATIFNPRYELLPTVPAAS